MKRWAIALAILLVPTATHAAEPEVSKIENLANEALKTWDVPGLAIAVVRGDQTLVLKGFGHRRDGKPELVTADTVFPLASCSKAFTTTLLALLADDGEINWDDPLAKHLSTFNLSDPNANALLSIRDLLCHRSGLSGHDLLWYRAPWDIDEVLKRASLLPLDYPFRSGYRYSTIPYLAAGKAIERRTGEKWEKLVKSRICDPLGMTGVAFKTTEIAKNADCAEGHRLGKEGKIEVMPPYVMREPNPAGSVHATARDLAAWLKFHLSEGLAPDGKRLVSAKNLGETHCPQNIIRLEGAPKDLNPDTIQLSYGMGWLVYDHRGKKVVSHGGLIDGFRIQITFLPDEHLGIAVLANLHDTRVNAALTNTLIDLYCGLSPRDWTHFFQKIVAEEKEKAKTARDASERYRDPGIKLTLPPEDYAREYTHPAYGTAKVSLEGKKLVLTWSSFTCPLEHFRGDFFQVTEGFFEGQLVPFVVAEGKPVTLKFVTQEFKSK